MENRIDVLKDLLKNQLADKEIHFTGLENVAIFSNRKSYSRKPELYQPHIMFLVQGKKRIHLGDTTYIYDPFHYYVQTVPLPVECEAIAEEGEPIIGIVLKIDPVIVGEILLEARITPPSGREPQDCLYNSSMTSGILDSLVRLMKALDSEEDTRVLGPIFYKEILYRMLKGENGQILGKMAVNNRSLYPISRVINSMNENYADPVEVQVLAKEAGMSLNSFHSGFKAMTNTSPLQYIKNIRLHKAKEMIQLEGERANVAAQRVGYESVSQFSREYKRCFGIPPSKDRIPAAV